MLAEPARRKIAGISTASLCAARGTRLQPFRLPGLGETGLRATAAKLSRKESRDGKPGGSRHIPCGFPPVAP